MTYIHIDEEPSSSNAGVPQGALVILGLFAVAVIALSAVARISNTGTLGEKSTAEIVASRALIFSDHADGSIGVFDSQHAEQLDDLPGGSGGFVRERYVLSPPAQAR